MVFANILIGIASLVSAVLGALPESGGTYTIQNPQSELVVDDYMVLATPGNPIIGFPMKKTDRSNEQWTLTQIATVGPSSGVYLFTCVKPKIQIYVNGLPGERFNAQNFGSPLIVTELSDGVYSIGFPLTSLAMTTTGKTRIPLTLQPFEISNPLQQWVFSSASDVPRQSTTNTTTV